MVHKEIRINKKTLILALCFLAFYIPQSYAVSTTVYSVWRMAYMIVGAGATLFLVLKTRTKHPSKGYYALMAFYIWIFVFTLIFSNTSEFKYYNFIKCVGFISLLECAFITRSKKEVIKSFLIAGVFISIIHFISFAQYAHLRGGMRHGVSYYTAGILRTNSNQNWYFLTYDNNSIYYFLPVIVLLFIYGRYINRKIMKYSVLYTLFIFYMYLIKISVAALVSMIFLIAGYFYLFRTENHLKRIHNIDYNRIVFFGIIIDAIPILILGGKLAFNINSFFGKRGGFSGRDIIWAKSLTQIGQHLLFGNGFEDSAMTWQKIGQTHCHNLLLEIMYIGGLIGFALFLLVIYTYHPKSGNLNVAKLFSVTIVSFFIAGSMDWLAYNPLPMSLFVFNYYLSNGLPRQDSLKR